MNSINILSSHVSPTGGSTPSRSNSISALGLAVVPEEEGKGGSGSGSTSINSNSGSSILTTEEKSQNSTVASFPFYELSSAGDRNNSSSSSSGSGGDTNSYSGDRYGGGRTGGRTSDSPPMASVADETTPLLAQKDTNEDSTGAEGMKPSKWRVLPKRIAVTVWNSIHWFLQTLAAPGVYLIACLYDEQGAFAPLRQFKLLFGRGRHAPMGPRKKASAAALDDQLEGSSGDDEKRRLSAEDNSDVAASSGPRSSRPFSVASSAPIGSSYAVSSESESDFDRKGAPTRKPGSTASRRGTTGSRSSDDGMANSAGAGGATSNRRSVRIKVNDDSLRQRKHRKGQSSSSAASLRSGGGSSGSGEGYAGSDGGDGITKDISAQLKSPTSPAGALTKYPRTPAPPRPLIPRRQPSFLNFDFVDRTQQKTLILDLDETLIHSMSKGGRMSTGHMVEVRLNTTFVGMGGQPSIGPQHPILYYVHKRPYCDEFLRRVCKWYNLVVFTASVQEYADPVIDWLESERKYFSARYYRQHCTYRHGAFIKDLSAVEPDLSKVMILDNSPLSYMFHQDNAIPIQGWISDHTDNDLLHLVPLLEGLQYVSDVRALLALRGGEDGRHMA
ncbi:nif domain containing protein [Niveomyces insectorum RCEF 264]|uniref:Nif domain containing protein n=1 Tax=Niveomyces insectorum RCEF 264 TaxID=1081102 RepID=A0A167ZBD5_9HYPO|nr:nif domain containing protein [Niveomyces insectorum RCEF 264]